MSGWHTYKVIKYLLVIDSIPATQMPPSHDSILISILKEAKYAAYVTNMTYKIAGRWRTRTYVLVGKVA